MRIFVVTPYAGEIPAWLIAGHESVKAQSVPARHVLICDGGEPARIPDFDGTHIILNRTHGDHGNTPRLIGCFHAVTQGADAIAFLNADHWYQPDHLRGLAELAATHGLAAVSSARMLHRQDGSPMLQCPVVDGVNHVDTSCLMVLKPAFGQLLSWVLDGLEGAAEADQALWRAIRQSGAPMAFLDRPTLSYRTRHPAHYRLVGETAPDLA